MRTKFRTMEQLQGAAQMYGFRMPREGESDESYRSDLSDHVCKTDVVAGMEIHNGKGWQGFDELENLVMLATAARHSAARY